MSHPQLQGLAGCAGPWPPPGSGQPWGTPRAQWGDQPPVFSPRSISSKELTELIERLQKNADQVEKNIVETDSRMQNVSKAWSHTLGILPAAPSPLCLLPQHLLGSALLSYGICGWQPSPALVPGL